ncbi:DUF2799 domain-containing protein [Roseateles sp. MS654]|uniref:DUF2799 domain-containing protein n=1 Tax=Roseateles sp. MS654 TaxID=3412685 RepID=UPI003C2B8C5A
MTTDKISLRARSGVHLLFAAGLLAGCSVMSKSECQQADWRELGRQDASEGRAPSYLADRAAACAKAGVQGVDTPAYMAGHAQGLLAFCTVEAGFDFGCRGRTYRRTCPAESRAVFQGGYRLGKDLHDLNQRLERIDRDQAAQRGVLADAKTQQADRDAAARQLRQLDSDEASVRHSIWLAEQDARDLGLSPARWWCR